jgi:hypothetical protein
MLHYTSELISVVKDAAHLLGRLSYCAFFAYIYVGTDEEL